MGGASMLAELDKEEAERLRAESFPAVHTYARDADGRIWDTDLLPLERARCLNLVPPWHYAFLQAHNLIELEIDLPAGWKRIVRRQRGTGRLIGEIEAVDDGSDDFFQRWPDGADLPTQ
jgi:hypothetical protein